MSQGISDPDIPALSRPCFMGQLYSATRSCLLNVSLFGGYEPKDIPAIQQHGVTQAEWEESSDIKERHSLLDINASMSVSLMSGLMTLSGSGSYFDLSERKDEQITLAGTLKVSIVRQRWNPTEEDLQAAVVVSTEKLQKMFATHVVTAITYGGRVLGTLKQTNSSLVSNTVAKGDFNLKFAKSFGMLGSAGGEAHLSLEDKQRIEKYDLEIGLMGDYLDPDPLVKVPVTIEAFSNKVVNAGNFIGDGVPVEITLTPLKIFNKSSAALMYDQVNQAELTDMMSCYNRLIEANKQRLELSLQVDHVGRDLFPHFCGACRERSEILDLFVTTTRGRLGTLLREHSMDTPDRSQTIAAFLTATNDELNKQEEWLRTDRRMFANLQEVKDETAMQAEFPVASIQEVSATMCLKTTIAVALVIIPDNVRIAELGYFYRELKSNLIKLVPPNPGTDVDASSSTDANTSVPGELVCRTIIAERTSDDSRALKEAVLLIDSSSGSLSLALNTVLSTSSPVLAAFGLSSSIISKYEWQTSAQDGWGIIDDDTMNTRYIGQVKNKLAHGQGVKLYAAGQVHTGSFFEGDRDGPGILLYPNVDNPEVGVYLHDRLNPKAKVATVTVYQGTSLVRSATFAVPCAGGDPPEPLGHPIETIQSHLPVQVAKMAKALDWGVDAIHRLRTVWDIKKEVLFEPTIGPVNEVEYWRFRSLTSVTTQGDQVQSLDFVNLEDVTEGDLSLYTTNAWIDGGLIINPTAHRFMTDFSEFVLIEAEILPPLT